MSAKNNEGFFRKISGNRRGSFEQTTLEKDTSDNRRPSGDLINSVKIDPFQERSPGIHPITNISKQHKIRRAIMQVFDPLRPKSEILGKDDSPKCGRILERYNKECEVKDGQAPKEAQINYNNVLSVTTSSLTASSILNDQVNIPVEELSSHEVTNQSSDKNVIKANCSIKKYSKNLLDLSYVDILERQVSQDIAGGSKVSFAATSLISPRMPTKFKRSSSPHYSEDPVREQNILNMQLKVENEMYHEKLEMMNEENEIVKVSIENYAKELEGKLIEITSLTTSYEQMKMHFHKLQDAFAVVYNKFNNAKDVIKGLQWNEKRLKKNLVNAKEEIGKYTNMYSELYGKSINEMNELNSAVLNNRKVYKQKMANLKATVNSLHEKELRLVQQLVNQTKESERLATLCQNASGSHS